MKPARFFMLDARAAWPVFVMLLHMRSYTMIFAVVVMIIFYFLEQRGLSFFAALRSLRSWIVTKKRPAWRSSDLTRMVDFGFEPLPQRFLDEGKEMSANQKNAQPESVVRSGADKTVRTTKKS